MRLLYVVSLKKALLVLAFILCLFVLVKNPSQAAITAAKDTVTTSRPSPSSPLNASLATSDSQATVFNNGSRFLASDSAKIIKTTTTAIADNATIVASQSSGLTSVFFGETAGTQGNITLPGHAGADVLYVPITSMHIIQFITGQTLDTTGGNDTITLTFPVLTTGDANNPASPSASTFQMNSIGTSQVKVEDDTANFTNFTAVATNPTAGTNPTITITITSGSIAAGSVVKLYLGCDTWSGAACTVQAPRIINPTKNSSTTCSGSPETCTATSYKLVISTTDTQSATSENTTVGIGIIESVTVRATVDPTLSFTITGINSGSDIGSGNTGCNAGTFGVTSNSGINSSANTVNLGILQNTSAAGSTPPNIAAQLISVATNGIGGYALTATSSSSLMNPSTGYFLPALTTPSYFPASAPFFGLHPCGNDVNNTTWVEDASANDTCNFQVGNNGAADDCYWGWPTTGTTGNTTPLSIASDASGPVGSGTGETGDGNTSVAYAAGINVNVPPGEYRAVVTYIATPSF